MLRIWKHRRLLIGLMAVAALVALAAWPKSVEVDVATISRGPLTVTVDEEGETRVRERFVVSAPVAGELLRIELEPGDPVVRARTVLATIRPAAPELLDARATATTSAEVRAAAATLEGGRARHEQARATLVRAQQQLARSRELFNGQVISRDELEAKVADARVAEEGERTAAAGVTQAAADLQAARARLLQTGSPTAAPSTVSRRGVQSAASTTTRGASGRDVVVVAPIDGVVLKRQRESQTIVPAGEALLELGDAHRLEVIADLLSSDAVKVRAGQPVLIDQWGGGRSLRGRVRRVEPSGFLKVSALGVEEQRVNVLVDFDDAAEAWQALGDAFRVEVRIVVAEAPRTLKAPTGSLFRRGDQWALFVVEDGRARLRPVTLGQRNAAEAEIVKGIGEHDRVVLYPPDTLADGARVIERTI